MSDSTPRLGLPDLPDTPELYADTVSEAFLRLDSFTGLCLKAQSVNDPPATPADGDAYLVGAVPTGAWSGYAGKLACCLDGGWRFHAPFAGLVALVADENRLMIFDGAAWSDMAAAMRFENLSMLGIQAAADTTNRLAVKSAALLFDHDGAGVQAKLNKHAGGDTASLLYQDGYSGRAELGLCGDDNFHLKVSPDGAAWTESLVIDKSSGYLGKGTATPLAPIHVGWQNQAFAGTMPGSVTLGAIAAVSGDGVTQRFITLMVAGNTPNFQGVRFNGTLAAPSAVLANQGLVNMGAGSFNGSGFVSPANFIFISDEDFSTSANGTRFELQLAAVGSNVRATRFIAYGDGRFGGTGARLDMSCSRQVPVSGFAIAIADACGLLLLDPAGTLASGTLTMPAHPKDGQLCRIVSTAAVTALTHSAATGQTLVGGLSSLAANVAAEFIYVATTASWYRV